MIKMVDYCRPRVQRGAMYLDLTVPGWYRRIDLVRLRLSSACDCIIGQLKNLSTNQAYANSGDGFRVAALSLVPEARDFGVAIFPASGLPRNDKGINTPHRRINDKISCHSIRYFSILDALWTKEINERLHNHQTTNREPLLSQVSRRRKQQLIARFDTIHYVPASAPVDEKLGTHA